MKKKYHYADKYLLSPTHPVTIVLIGCGGTGSRVLTSLAMIHKSLQALTHPGLMVTVYDNDVVQEPNIGRQLFYESDLSLNKAIVLVSRINRSFGTAWKANPEKFDNTNAQPANIYISCVDSAKSRIEIAEVLRNNLEKCNYSPYLRSIYWLDYGNTQKTGQMILGTLTKVKQPKSRKYQTVSELPIITDRFDLTQIKDKNLGPSCSHAQSLAKQDLFINTSLATLGCHVLWELLREGRTDKAGLYLNLGNMRSNYIPL